MGRKRKHETEDPQVTLGKLMKKMEKMSKEVQKVQERLDKDKEDSSQGLLDKENIGDNSQDDTRPQEALNAQSKDDTQEMNDTNSNEEVIVSDKEEAPDLIVSDGELDWQDIVGEDPLKSKALSAVIKPDLLNVWKTYCRVGLKKEEEEAIIQKYECAQELKAPELNPQVAAKITPVAKARDGHMVSIQKLTGLAMSIMGSLMTKIHDNRKEGIDLVEILEPLKDAGKILTVLMHKQSLNRSEYT